MNELSEAQGPLLRYHKGKEVQDMKYLKIFTDFLEIAQGLSDSTLARLFRAMLAYALNDTEPAFKGSERALWLMVRQSIDREKEAYENKVKYLKRGNGPVSKPTDPVSNQDKDKEEEKDKDKEEDNDSLSSGGAPGAQRENRPTLEEVMAFSQEAGLQTDVQYFFDYYEANGWYIGKQPIRNWKAALRAWAKKAPTKAGPAQELTVGDNFKKAMEMLRMEEAKQI